MIFKFDKGGNMENIGMEGDLLNMRRKNKVSLQTHTQNEEVNRVIQEVKEGIELAKTETSVGFESLNEIINDGNENDDMIQQHETDDGEKWEESNKPAFGSLSEKTKMEELEGEDKTQMSVGEFNSEFDEKQKRKDELKIKREQNKIKKEFKDREKQLNLKKESNDKSWSFDNISVIMRDGAPYKFNLSLSALQLAEMYSVTNQIYYEESTQRGEKVTKSKGNIPLVNIGHSKKFLKAVLEDSKVDGGTIYLNYAKENPTPLHYDQISNTLSGEFPLYVNDGAHRLESCVMWLKLFKRNMLEVKNPDEYYFSVTILNATHEESENVFVALNSLGLPVSKTRIAFHDTYNLNNAIAKNVMNNSFFRGRIELISNSLKRTSNCVMTFNTLSKGCSIMSPETPNQIEETGKYLCSYFNEIVELFPKIFGNVTPEIRQEERTKVFIGEVMFINALFSLAKEVQGMDDWKERLKKLSQDNFLSRDNDLFRFCLREGNKLINSSKVQKDITNLIIGHVMAN